jgi:hypothetical protein
MLSLYVSENLVCGSKLADGDTSESAVWIRRLFLEIFRRCRD